MTFQSTLPVGGATRQISDGISIHQSISIHAPRGGSDSKYHPLLPKTLTFQSTLPVGGATFVAQRLVFWLLISIHAPRGGSDADNFDWQKAIPISIHAPRGGSDTKNSSNANKDYYFNPRSPWGERLTQRFTIYQMIGISIHAPRGGSDVIIMSFRFAHARFQSTLPVGGATAKMHSFPCSSLARVTKNIEKATKMTRYIAKDDNCWQLSHKKVRAKLWGNSCSLALRS